MSKLKKKDIPHFFLTKRKFLLCKVGGDMMTAVAAITSVRKVLQTASSGGSN
jgi:hypothetical protein